MALKTFNIDAKAYELYSKFCKEQGMSMSKKVENFIKGELDKFKLGDKPELKKDIIEKEHSFRKYC
jgi:hypothetical protein